MSYSRHTLIATLFIGSLCLPALASASDPGQPTTWSALLQSRPSPDCIRIDGETAYGSFGQRSSDDSLVLLRIQNNCDATFEMTVASCKAASCDRGDTCKQYACSEQPFTVEPGMTQQLDAGMSQGSSALSTDVMELDGGTKGDATADTAEGSDPNMEDAGGDGSDGTDAGMSDAGSDASDGPDTGGEDTGMGSDTGATNDTGMSSDIGAGDAGVTSDAGTHLPTLESYPYRLGDLGLSASQLDFRYTIVDATFDWRLIDTDRSGQFTAQIDYAPGSEPASGCFCSAPDGAPLSLAHLVAPLLFALGALGLRRRR